ncbi:MAG: aldo/keto reductase [Halanaerobiaceae bacterium]
MQNIKLKSGDEIPILGLGTWQMTGRTCTEAVKNALELGYRHIDTADIYKNHLDIAPALKESDLDRSELFITSKVFRENLHYEDVLKSERFLKELGIEYLDLLLIHWPNKNVPIKETLKGLAELKEKGIAKNIGVSNFTIDLIKEAMEYYPELITVNQVEFHPFLYQKELLNFCREKNIVLTAYSPLARGKIFQNDVIVELAEKINKSPAQLVLKWLIDKEIVVIPKASSIEHIRDNMDLFDWEIPAEIVGKIDNINTVERLIDPPFSQF